MSQAICLDTRTVIKYTEIDPLKPIMYQQQEFPFENRNENIFADAAFRTSALFVYAGVHQSNTIFGQIYSKWEGSACAGKS